VLFIVDADPQDSAVTESALARRLGPTTGCWPPAHPRARWTRCGAWRTTATTWRWWQPTCTCPARTAWEFLERARALHPGTWRVLLVNMDRHHTRVPFTERAALQRATALGRIDFSVVKGWITPEEWLYPQIQEALTAWTIAHRPSHVIYRIVGEQWAPRSHELRDMLTRNSVLVDHGGKTPHVDVELSDELLPGRGVGGAA
jgi:thioredoxin reductase (NADPH)